MKQFDIAACYMVFLAPLIIDLPNEDISGETKLMVVPYFSSLQENVFRKTKHVMDE